VNVNDRGDRLERPALAVQVEALRAALPGCAINELGSTSPA
jgi:hypothetical protein